MFYVAGHRMCKTRLKMMVSCAQLTRTTQLHPTGHHRDDDIHNDDRTDLYDVLVTIMMVIINTMMMIKMILMIIMQEVNTQHQGRRQKLRRIF